MDSPIKKLADSLRDEKPVTDKTMKGEIITKVSDDLTDEERKRSNEAYISGGCPEQEKYLRSIGKYSK